MATTDLISVSLTIYGMAAAISFGVALLIMGIVIALPALRREPKPEAAAPAPAVAAEAPDAVPPEHVAAIAAAVAAVTRDYRIVRIEDTAGTRAWSSEGRMMHQTSHNISRRSRY